MFSLIGGTCLECFDGDRCCVVPQSLPDLPKLAVPELPDELQAGPVDLPVVPSVVRQPVRGWLLNLGRFTDNTQQHLYTGEEKAMGAK